MTESGIGFLRSERKKNAEVGSRIRIEKFELASHLLGESASNGKSYPGAGNSFGERRVETGEGGEDFSTGRAGDAGAVVDEVDGELVLDDLGGKLCVFTRSVFLDVREKVAEDLFAGVGVGVDGCIGGKMGFDGDFCEIEGGLPVIEAGGDEVFGVE